MGVSSVLMVQGRVGDVGEASPPSGVEGRSPGRTSEGRSTPESEAFNEFYRILQMPNEFYFEIRYFNFD